MVLGLDVWVVILVAARGLRAWSRLAILLVLWVWCDLVRRRSLDLACVTVVGLSRLCRSSLLVAFSSLVSRLGLSDSVVVCPLVSGRLFLHRNRVMHLNSKSDVKGSGRWAAILMMSMLWDWMWCSRLISFGRLNMLCRYLCMVLSMTGNVGHRDVIFNSRVECRCRRYKVRWRLGCWPGSRSVCLVYLWNWDVNSVDFLIRLAISVDILLGLRRTSLSNLVVGLVVVLLPLGVVLNLLILGRCSMTLLLVRTVRMLILQCLCTCVVTVSVYGVRMGVLHGERTIMC